MLHTLYRPTTFDEFVGNTAVINSVKKMLDEPAEKRVKSFLITGPSGCGKTTLARIIATYIGCKEADIVEVNARGIDDVRQIISMAQSYSLLGNNKVFILDEVHHTTVSFQNAILKVLEEPPIDTYFILCTTNPEKLLNTIRRRCASIQLKPLTDTQMRDTLYAYMKKENITIPSDVVDLCMYYANNSLGFALMYLNQVRYVKTFEEGQQILVGLATDEQTIWNLLDAIVQQKPWSTVIQIYKSFDISDYEIYRKQILGVISKKLMSVYDKRLVTLLSIFITPWYEGESNALLAIGKAYAEFNVPMVRRS